MGNVKKENGCVWVPDVPILIYEMQKDNSLIGSVEAALSISGYPYDYAALMGLSSIALSFKWYKGNLAAKWDNFLPGHYQTELELLSRATGWRFRIECSSDFEFLKHEIINSINNGIPVICSDKAMGYGVIFGYEEGADIVFIKPYIDPSANDVNWNSIIKKNINALYPSNIFIDGRMEPLARQESMTNAFSRALQNWYYDGVNGDKGSFSEIYHYGENAYNELIRDIENADSLSIDDKKSLDFMLWWHCIWLKDARNAAVVFLRNSAALPVKDKRCGLMDTAAILYMEEVRLLKSFCEKNPWRPEYEISSWSKEVRQNDIDRFKKIKELDGKAVSLLEEILL